MKEEAGGGAGGRGRRGCTYNIVGWSGVESYSPHQLPFSNAVSQFLHLIALKGDLINFVPLLSLSLSFSLSLARSEDPFLEFPHILTSYLFFLLISWFEL